MLRATGCTDERGREPRRGASELDALRWERVDFGRDRIVVAEQFNAATRKFDTPKNHLRREALLTTHARTALDGLLSGARGAG